MQGTTRDITERCPDAAVITVSDTGEGIPEENLGRVFEPLFSTRTQGIGVGLALARRLTEARGGAVDAESQVGRGSTFTVRLPLKKREEPG